MIQLSLPEKITLLECLKVMFLSIIKPVKALLLKRKEGR
jgi:hypothetical protein